MGASSEGAAGVSTSLAGWFATPLGRYVAARELAYFERTVADIFGYYALQIGLPEMPVLDASRIPSRWTLDYDPPAALIADPHALPLPENTVDLVVMPHALEFTDDPHQMLREAWRVMRPEGQIVIAGFNPFSLYGVKRYFGREQTPPSNWVVSDTPSGSVRIAREAIENGLQKAGEALAEITRVRVQVDTRTPKRILVTGQFQCAEGSNNLAASQRLRRLGLQQMGYR